MNSKKSKALHAIVVLPPGLAGRIKDKRLRRWLSKGTLKVSAPAAQMLFSVVDLLGQDASDDGLAALHFWGQTGERSGAWMAAADPVHLEARLDHLYLHDLSGKKMPMSDLRSIFDFLQTTFGSGNIAFARIGHQGYLRGEKRMATAAVPARTVDGQRPDDWMPAQGEDRDADDHYRLLSEVQMSLHEHEVNLRRTNAGQREVNSLWIWGLPAAGRRVLGGEAEALLCDELPRIVEEGLLWEQLPRELATRFVLIVENQEWIREQLLDRGLVAFVADGSLLPRESGASDRPMSEGAVRFRAPETLRVSFELPHPVDPRDPDSHHVSGLGIPRGVTLIVGGGYHGKSTLLRALERGIHPHVPGDGRELVVTSRGAVKIRAEDGRRVEACDISSFIDDLPQGRSTRSFTSEDASGSTSQAANIVEALELGATTLLLDEDTSATNFMVRDARMQALVHEDHEPITPFVDRVRELYERLGVSTVLVMGGCGDYFDVADTVIEMREYLPADVTAEAKSIAASHQTRRRVETRRPLAAVTRRVPVAESLDPSRGRREVKIDAKAVDLLVFGTERIDLRGLEQLADVSQTRAVGYAIELARERFMGEGATLGQVMDAVEDTLDEAGLEALDPFRRGERHPGNFARPRRFEIGGALNRLRTLRIERGDA